MTDSLSPRQIPFDLPARPALGREDFLVAPSNAEAVALIDRWPGWTTAWAVIHGPEGSGKSHLAGVWAERAGAQRRALATLRAEDVPEALAAGALVLEAENGPPFDEAALFHLINLTAEDGAHLLITARSAPSGWPVARADLGSRLRAMPAAALEAPDDTLLAAVLVKLFHDRQLVIEPPVIDYLTARMERSFAEAARLVDALDRLSLEDKRPITTRLAARVLDRSARA